MPTSATFSSEFDTWADATGHDDLTETVTDLSRLTEDHLDHGLADLTGEDLERLLLDACPRELVVSEPDTELPRVLAAVEGVIGFLEATGRVTREHAADLRARLAEVGPLFPDAVMDRQRWSPVKLINQLAIGQGVDISDPESVQGWLEELRPAPSADDLSRLPLIPPVRLPADTELAAAVRVTPLVAELIRLTDWLGPGREITGAEVLTPDAALAALSVLKLVDPPPAAVPDAAKVPELEWLWWLAVRADVLELEFEDDDDDEFWDGDLEEFGGMARPGPGAADLRSGDDQEVLRTWRHLVFAVLDEQHPAGDTDGLVQLSLAPVALRLFAHPEGLTPGELAATSPGRDQLRLSEEGVEGAAGVLARAGLAEPAGPSVKPTPLGIWATRHYLRTLTGSNVPILGSLAGSDATALLTALRSYGPEEITEELAGWLADRSAATAASEIAQAIPEVSPLSRAVGLTLLGEHLGADGEAELDALRRTSRIGALLSARDAEDEDGRGPEFQPDSQDLPWVLADLGAALMETGGPVDQVVDALAGGMEPAETASMIEILGRADHPWAGPLLRLFSTHPDTRISGAAHRGLRILRGDPPDPPGARGRKPKKPKKSGKSAASRKKRRR